MATGRSALVAVALLLLLQIALAASCLVDADCPDGCNTPGSCLEGQCLRSGDLCCSEDEDCPAMQCSAAICNDEALCQYFFKEGCVVDEPPVSAPPSGEGDDGDYGAPSPQGEEPPPPPPPAPTVRHGCIYSGDTTVACAETLTFDCSSTWGFKIWVPVSNSITHMILVDAVNLSVFQSSFQSCYRLANSACYSCIYLTDAVFDYSDTFLSVEAHVQFTSQCDSDSGVYFLDFGRVQGSGLACGQEGYNYLPCGEESPFTVTQAPPLWDVIDSYRDAALDVRTDALGDLSRSAASDSIELIGTCGYYVHHSSVRLLSCFSVTFDTCAQDAYLVSTAGMDVQLPLTANNHEASVMGCLPTSDGAFVCTRVSNIVRGSTTLSLRISMSVTRDDAIIAEGQFGTLEYEFPQCGQRSTCNTIASGPGGNNNNNGNTGGTAGGNAGGSTNNNNGNGDGVGYNGYYGMTEPSSSGLSTFWVVFISIMAIGVTVVVIGAVAVAVYLKKRRDSFSDPDNAYQLMIM